MKIELIIQALIVTVMLFAILTGIIVAGYLASQYLTLTTGAIALFIVVFLGVLIAMESEGL